MKELYEDSLKRRKEESDTYRNNISAERLQAKLETDFIQSQKVCQNLDIKAAEVADTEVFKNILWRGLDRGLEMQLRDKQFRNRMMYERRPNRQEGYDNEEYSSVLQKLDDDDEKLDEFEALPIENRIDMVLHYMRVTYWYCFW